MSITDIHQIINEAKKGSQSAYTDLLNRFWNDIYRFIAAKTNNDYETEDLTIKTFSKAFDKIQLYDSQYAFKNWLLTIANNLFIDYYRSQQNMLEDVNVDKEKVLKIPDETTSAEDQLIQEQQLAELLQYLKHLKPHYRQVIQLRYFQELSIKEIADEMQEPVNNVKVKLLRAKNLLGEMIRRK